MQKTRVVVDLFDDLDLQAGTETKADATHRLALDGQEVLIDLTEVHGKELADAFSRYLAAGRQPKARVPRTGRGGSRTGAIMRNKAIRAYAASRGLAMPEHRADYKTLRFKEVARLYDEEVARGTAPASY